jgi:hypothetical protein
MVSRRTIWLVGLVLVLGLTSAVMAAQKPFLWDGSHWSQVSFEGKAGYIFGIGNLADFEKAVAGQSPCVSRAFAEELKNKTVDQVIATVDKFYKENPDKQKTTVIEVILQRFSKACPPQTKSGGKK